MKPLGSIKVGFLVLMSQLLLLRVCQPSIVTAITKTISLQTLDATEEKSSQPHRNDRIVTGKLRGETGSELRGHVGDRTSRRVNVTDASWADSP